MFSPTPDAISPIVSKKSSKNNTHLLVVFPADTTSLKIRLELRAVNSVVAIAYIERNHIESSNLSLNADISFSDIFLYLRSALAISALVFFSAVSFISFSVCPILLSRFATALSRPFRLFSRSQRPVISFFSLFFSSSIFFKSKAFFFCNSSAFFSSKSLFCNLSFSAVTCRTRDISF